MRHHYTDLVHVRSQHDPLAAFAVDCGTFHRDQVAESVRPHLINQPVQMAADHLADPLLLPARAVDTAQFLDQNPHASLRSGPNGRARGPDNALLISLIAFFTSAGSISAAGV